MTMTPVRPQLCASGSEDAEDVEKELKDWEVILEDLETDDEGKAAKEDEVIEDEETLIPKYMRDPGLPTPKERAEHDILHINYRPWCKFCVMGRGQSDHHTSVPKEAEDLQVPTISMDYMFLGTKHVKAKERTCLTAYDNRTGGIQCFMVRQKGPVEWAVEGIEKFIRDQGYSKNGIAVETDNEVSIMAVREAIMLVRDAPTTPLDTAVKESQGNGGMERAIKTIQGQYRTILCQLVEKLGESVKDNFEFFTMAFQLGVHFHQSIQNSTVWKVIISTCHWTHLPEANRRF